MFELIGKLLSGAVGGGLLGIAGQFLVAWMETRRLDAESRRRISEMRALAEMKAEESAWGAFAAAQTAAQPPQNVPPWCAAVITLTRPALTLLLLCFAVYVYSTATPQVRGDMTTEIVACAFGAVWFWFGSRYQSRLAQKPKA